MMTKQDSSRLNTSRQARLDALFDAEADFWSDLYAAQGVLADVHRYRTALTLAWIDELDLAAAAPTLEVGCGAGLLSVELARRGLDVDATDPVETMLDLARRAAEREAVTRPLRFSRADVHALDFRDQAFELVVGLGVMPWIDTPEIAIAEMARVLAPGGRLIVSINNRTPLHALADPVRLPLLAPLRDRARRAISVVRPEWRLPPARPTTFARPPEFMRLLHGAGLQMIRSQAFGFGPFTVLGRTVLPDRLGVVLERRLQSRAEKGDHVLEAIAAQYLVLARRPLA